MAYRANRDFLAHLPQTFHLAWLECAFAEQTPLFLSQAVPFSLILLLLASCSDRISSPEAFAGLGLPAPAMSCRSLRRATSHLTTMTRHLCLLHAH